MSLTKRIRLVSIELMSVNIVSKNPNKVTEIDSALSASWLIKVGIPSPNILKYAEPNVRSVEIAKG